MYELIYKKTNERLGVFYNKEKAFEAYDTFWAMGYKNLEIKRRSYWKDFFKKYF